MSKYSYSSVAIETADQYVEKLFAEQLSERLVYHNYAHTQEVVEAVIEIGKAEGVSDEEMELLVLAALFHDIGHIKGYDGHEDYGKEIAQEFLITKRVSQTQIDTIKEIIDATKMPQSPTTTLQKILADADLYHLSNKTFHDKAALLREEWAIIMENTYSDEEWIKQNVYFLQEHQYFTNYGKQALEPVKLKVIKKQKKLLKKAQEEMNIALMNEMNVNEAELKNLKKKLSKVSGRPERGVETMFRTTSKNHLDLSSMADSKANIMISVNAIIISVVVGGLASKLDENQYLILPTAILLITCLAATIFAVLATRPNVTSGTFSKEDIENKKANLLFFGNFHNMKLTDFEWGMNQLINDSEYLYGSMIRDIYFLGAVLGKKYHLLRTSYTIFMYGLIVSVIAFLIAGFGLIPPDLIPFWKDFKQT